MPLTIEQYHKYNASQAQRRKIKRDELQSLLDEHLNTDGNVASLRGIIRDELNTKFEEMKTELSNTINVKIKTVADENDRLSAENVSIKRVLQEHQKYFERARKDETNNNIFISGIPKVLLSDMSGLPNAEVADEDTTADHVGIIHHILNFVNPGMTKEQYKILFNFDAKENYSRHSAKIRVQDIDTKSKLFKGCTKFKQLRADDFLKKIFIKNDDPPLTRKENERLYKKMKELSENEDRDNPENRYFIKKGKLCKNTEDDCLDEFNVNNQLFLSSSIQSCWLHGLI